MALFRQHDLVCQAATDDGQPTHILNSVGGGRFVRLFNGRFSRKPPESQAQRVLAQRSALGDPNGPVAHWPTGITIFSLP